MERKTIKENFLTIDSINGSLNEIIKFLMERKSFYTSLGYKNIEIQSSYSEMYGVEFQFYGDRPETDEEMNNRIKFEERKKKKSEKVKQSKLDRDKKEFERLKKKFG